MAETLEIILKDAGAGAGAPAVPPMPQGQATALLLAQMQEQQEQIRRDVERIRDVMEHPEADRAARPDQTATGQQQQTTAAGKEFIQGVPEPKLPDWAGKQPGTYTDGSIPDPPMPTPAHKGPGLPEPPPGGKPPTGGAGGKPPVPAGGGAGGAAGAAGKAGAGAAGAAGGAAGIAGAVIAIEKEIVKALKGGVESAGRSMTATAALDPGAFAENLSKAAERIPIFGEALAEGTKQARAFLGALEGTGKKLAMYSAPLAQASAMNEIKTILGDIKRAEILGTDLAGVMEEITEIREMMKTMLARFLKPLLPIIQAVLQEFSEFLKFLENAFRKFFGLGDREVEKAMNFAEEILGGGNFPRPVAAPPRAR